MENSLYFNYQARYSSLGTPGHTAWLVCHGYGQLASYFIRNFQELADAGHYIVAPEGLSRFYLQGTSGRVGASWMTREERLTDIRNYLAYLDAVAEHAALGQCTRLNLLGFSQGVATICRWAMHTHLHFHKLVLWAGVFPPDLSPDLSSSRLKETALYQVWGRQDPYLQQAAPEEQTNYLQALGSKSFESLLFEGEHRLHPPTLMEIARAVP